MASTRLLLMATAAALFVAGCSSSHKSGPGTTTTAPSSTGSSSTTPTTSVPATTTTTAGPTATTVSAGGPLPAGFTVTDLTWVSNNQGWALGTAPCAHPPCTSIAHTLDGGQTWAGLPAPKAYLAPSPAFPTSYLPSTPGGPAFPSCSATLACVHGIRFADASVGYAFGASSMWLTTNGGHTWTEKSKDPTDDLTVTNGTVLRITHPGNSGCPPGCPYQVQATAVGTTSWHNVSAPVFAGVGAELTAEGSNVYLAVFGHVAGGAEDAHTQFARSGDLGAHWSNFPDPCTVTATGTEADATTFGAAPGGYLAVGCSARTSDDVFVVVSADGGSSFGPHRGNLIGAVSASGVGLQHIAAATGQRLAVMVSAGSTAYLSVSNDSGVDWTVTHTDPLATTGPSNVFLGFEDATTGRAVVLPRTVLTTTDGGGHWTPFTFP